jgi:adenylate cyclase
LARLIPDLMTWLTQRYMEQRIVAGIVDGFEEFFATRGLTHPVQPVASHAVVFVDLSGYTRLTEERGDEMAVRAAASLQQRAEEVARDHGGRLVKLLGDGAMLHFRDPRRAVQAARVLVASLGADLGLQARAGVAAGPVIERDRDLFGRTVNLASRIVGTAGPGEVIVSEAVANVVEDAGLEFEALGPASLKGFTDAAPLFRVGQKQPDAE